jgi:hypothetical protein
VTSTNVTATDIPLQPTGSAMNSTTKQTFSSNPAVETWTRVSLFSTGKKARFIGAGYYFGFNDIPNDKNMRDQFWDMEDELYHCEGFKIVMLCALVMTFVGFSYLGAFL